MEKRQISARIIADSKNEFGQRLTSFVLVFPRIVLAEFNTHRMLSRNSASSRAIPFEKMLKMVQEDPFIPIRWMKDHKGMQGNEYFENEYDIQRLQQDWLNGRDHAVQVAQSLSDRGLTKQIVNRLLEPFLWHSVIATASDWQNFFALRAHPAAEIHIQELAHKMLEAYNESTPKQLGTGGWHIPFGDNIDAEKVKDLFHPQKETLSDMVIRDSHDFGNVIQKMEQYKIKIATARCARISYMNFEGKDDYEADIKLHDQLASSGHFSPFEHCAQALGGWSGNFYGFKQYRKMLADENKSDNRVVAK